jgi:hypothetical protein
MSNNDVCTWAMPDFGFGFIFSSYYARSAGWEDHSSGHHDWGRAYRTTHKLRDIEGATSVPWWMQTSLWWLGWFLCCRLALVVVREGNLRNTWLRRMLERRNTGWIDVSFGEMGFYEVHG